jgi:Family of unknown function (DUF6188)
MNPHLYKKRKGGPATRPRHVLRPTFHCHHRQKTPRTNEEVFMYGLPANTLLDFLKGKTLLQVCFGAHDLILNLTDKISISIFSSVGVGLEGSIVDKHTAFEEVSGDLLQFLNKGVADVHWTPEGTVTLIFDDRRSVQIYDDSPQYESYTINSPKGLMVV